VKLYLSASVANAPCNSRLAEVLPRHELVLPQEFTPDVPHAELPRAIVERCLAEMASSDAALLLLDAFGIDCAMEAGWLLARGKPVVGIAMASTRFAQHWMVKGCLTGIVCDPAVTPALVEDPILGSLPREEAAGWGALAGALDRVFDRFHGGGT